MSQVRIIPLGGVGEIGKNCTLVQQGNDALLVDCGLTFPDEDQYGVDIIVPDFAGLHTLDAKLHGIVITHPHEDHIGALPYLLEQFPVPIYCTELAEALIASKLADRLPQFEADIRRYEAGDSIEFGSLSVEPVRVTHSVPQTHAMAIRTDEGIVLFTSDFKIDLAPVDGIHTDLKRLGELGDEGVSLLLTDTTNVERGGWSNSESSVGQSFERIMAEAGGRVLITMFSSAIPRMQQVFDAAYETGRRVAIMGRRLEQVFSIAQALKLIKVRSGVHVSHDEMGDVAGRDLVILATGSQGEPRAALSQMSRGEHRRLQLKKSDTIVYAARRIPGNEGGIWKVVNGLVRQGCEVILDYDTPIHASGHGSSEEIRLMVNLTKPKYVAPVHGEPRHQKAFRDMMLGSGRQESRILMTENGDEIQLSGGKASVEFNDFPIGEVLVDQDSGELITKETVSERHRLANQGVIVVTAVLSKKGEILTDPQVRARGYAGSEESLEKAEDWALEALENLAPFERTQEKSAESAMFEAVRRAAGRFSRQKPLIVATITVSG